MIFGFNSDVKHDALVYHVQSEVREREQLLQTQVFVQGRCLGKRATPFDGGTGGGPGSEQQLHETLKAQHREIVEAIRAGQIASLFLPPPELRLQWLDAQPLSAENVTLLRFRLTATDKPVAGAHIVGRVDVPGQQPAYIEGESAEDGQIELRLQINKELMADAMLAVEATHASGTVRGRFRLRKK